jgi:hypothetical protein
MPIDDHLLELGNCGRNFRQLSAQKAQLRTRLSDFWLKKAYLGTRKTQIFPLKMLNFGTTLGRSFTGPLLLQGSLSVIAHLDSKI